MGEALFKLLDDTLGAIAGDTQHKLAMSTSLATLAGSMPVARAESGRPPRTSWEFKHVRLAQQAF